MGKTKSDQRKILIDIIKDAVVYKDDNPFMTSPSGKSQNWLLDLRKPMLNVDALDMITDMFWDIYEDSLPFQVGGMEVAAVPLVTAIILKGKQRGHAINGFLIRKERKKYGLGKNIEGVVTDDPVILVDDILNSGSSMEKSCVIVGQEDIKVDRVFVIVDYESNAGMKWRTENEIQVDSLLKADELDLQFTRNKTQLKVEYKLVWRNYTKGAFPFHIVPKSTPLLIGDKIYMGTSAAKMLCIDRLSGDNIWEYHAAGAADRKGIWSSPAHHNGRIYFGAYNGCMYCLDAETGAEIWKNPACEWIGSTPLIVPKHNMLYIGLEYQRPRMQGSNAALDLDTGTRIWETGQKKFQHGSAAYWEEDDYVVFGNADHDVTAYDAKTGKVAWKYETERSIKYPPAIDVDRKYVVAASFDGNIYVFNVKTGEKLAAIQTDDITYSTPLIAFDKIFCGSGDRHMYIIDANTLELIEKRDFGARIYSSPTVIDDRVLFGTSGGLIVEMEPDTLDVVGKTQLPDAITNAIQSTEGGRYIYASTHMNELYAIRRRRIG